MRKALATFFYVGYVPGAPGTAASVVAAAVIFVVLRLDAPVWVFPLLAALIAGVGCVIARHAKEDFGDDDPGPFVLDEVAGMLVAVSFVPCQTPRQALLIAVTALVAFRVFDIAKPFPCRRAERLPGGVGVVADDLVAGAMANVVTQIIGALWWMKT